MTTVAISEAVGSHEGWNPDERETCIRFGSGDKVADVYSAERTVAKHLLSNAEFEPYELTVMVGDHVERRHPMEHDGETIVAVKGTLPIGALSVKSEARTNAYHSSIVSTYDPEGET